jgi:hypothetical protein
MWYVVLILQSGIWEDDSLKVFGDVNSTTTYETTSKVT